MLLRRCGAAAAEMAERHGGGASRASLGYFNARVLLTVLFALVFVPLGLHLADLTARIRCAAPRRLGPGWPPYPARYRDRRHYERMY